MKRVWKQTLFCTLFTNIWIDIEKIVHELYCIQTQIQILY